MADPKVTPHPKLPKWVRIVRKPLAARERPGMDVVATSPDRVARFLQPMAETEEVEVVWMLALDTQHRVLSITEVTRGLVNASLLHAREVFRPAIVIGATSIIVAHNHPSGVPMPSPEDQVMTVQLAKAGQLLELPLVDSLIVTETGRYFSFAEAGLL